MRVYFARKTIASPVGVPKKDPAFQLVNTHAAVLCICPVHGCLLFQCRDRGGVGYQGFCSLRQVSGQKLHILPRPQGLLKASTGIVGRLLESHTLV